MDLAIITERLPTGEARYRTSQPGLTEAARRQAESLDKALHKEIEDLEDRLVAKGVLPREIPSEGEQLPRRQRTDVACGWHGPSQGDCKASIVGTRERRWLWEALQNLHAY